MQNILRHRITCLSCNFTESVCTEIIWSWILSLPIIYSCPDLLHQVLHYLHHQPALRGHDQRMLTATFTLAFHGFLRVSKCTMPPNTHFNPRYHPSTFHVALDQRYFTFTIPRSKTDLFHRGHTIRLDQTNPPSIFPVKHMRAYITPLSPAPSPLSLFSDG